MKIARDPKRDGRWQVVIPAQDTPVAEITLDEDGIFFSWGPACPPQVATLLHNCMLCVRSGKHKKTMQMRLIAAAPDVRLFESDNDIVQYDTCNNPARTRQEHSLADTNSITPEGTPDPAGAPFNVPTK